MALIPRLLMGKVMHQRLFPKENTFTYGIYYLSLPLPATTFPRNRLASFHAKDVGPQDGADPEEWTRAILRQYGLNGLVASIELITMPRVLGYVFNPVSFYLCRDDAEALRAVICEVHNTFGERHSYVCAHADRRPIHQDDIMEAEKVFHVSPFLAREGFYRFRFAALPETFGVWIDYCDAEGRKQLITSLVGRYEPLTQQSLQRAFWQHPLVTLKAISLIHWQALKLVSKAIRYIAKPPQLLPTVTPTRHLTKM